MKIRKNRWIAKLVAAIGCVAMLGSMVVNPATAKAAPAEKLSGKTASEIVTMMGPGFNIGNSLDATGGDATYIYGQESSWGNPRIRQELFDGMAEAGFTCVRVPITWTRQMSPDADGFYKVSDQFMGRIKEVVDYAYNAGLFVIINTHHDDFTEGVDSVNNVMTNAKIMNDLWSQISDTFADYDQHLIFESMNEPREGEKWTGNPKAHAAFNYMNTVFVNTVRCNGKGYNSERCLMIPGYAASPDSVKYLTLPTFNGEVCNNLIISTHSYTPYLFCLKDDDKVFDDNDKKEIDRVYDNLKKNVLDYGIPVVMGETGATNSGGNTADRTAWAEYFAAKSASYGVPVLIWDNGSNSARGGESHVYLDRTTGKVVADYESVTRAFIDGYKNAEFGSALTPKEEPSGTPLVNYYGNAGLFATTMEEQIAPEFPSMIFEGWYTTPDFKAGTELDLTALSGPVNAYAKYSLDLDMYGLKVPNGKGDAGASIGLGGIDLKFILIPVGVVVAAVIAIVIIGNVKKKKAN